MDHHGLAVDSFGAHTDSSCSALVAGGVSCVLRYHYNTTRREVDTVHGHGLSFCLIAEFDTATWHPPLHNPETGAEHARKAVAVAKRLGMPAGCKITLTADSMIFPAQFGRSARYWELAAPILRGEGYRVDAYGGSLFVDFLHERGLTDSTWEAAARSWSSPDGSVRNYRVSRSAVLRQLVEQPWYGGVQTDLNLILAPAAGEWLPGGSVSGGMAVVVVVPEEWRMKAVCTQHDGTQYRIVTDGFGRDRRSPVRSQAELAVFAAAELVDGGEPVVLTDPEQIRVFESIPVSNPDYTADLGALALAGEVVRQVVAKLPVAVGGAVDLDAIVAEVAGSLQVTPK